MSTEQRGASSQASIVINAAPQAVFDAFIDRDALVAWLPPAQMTGEIHELDARVGGGYVMSLFYPEDEREFRGKTTEREDRVRVRFVELAPPLQIVESVTFVTDDPALAGEMSITVSLQPVPGGTEVTMLFENLPAGLRPEDNDEGARISLEQLARRFE